MRQGVVESLFGAVVLAVAAFFLTFAYATSDVGTVDGYRLEARFTRIDGLNPGSDVRISGVKVGTILDIRLEEGTYLALVEMSIRDGIELPVDTVASVISDGLLGQKFMSLEVGAETDMLAPGDRIEFTQSTASIEQLLGQVIFSLQNEEQ